MGNFTFQCICCNTSIEVTSEQVGYVVYCPKCMAELIVPEFSGDGVTHSHITTAHDDDVPGDFAGYDDEVEHGESDDGYNPSQESPPVESGLHRSSASISQIIYRDAEGHPIIPEDVVRALSESPDALDGMTDTKLALAETLKALQANQRALAEARKELAARRHTKDTDHVKISDTSNQLVHEDYVMDTSQYDQNPPEPNLSGSDGLGDGPVVIVPKGQPVEDVDQSLMETHLEEPEYHAPTEYIPLYTPHGDFLPFTDEDFAHALEYEADSLFEGISQIRPTPQCWSYSVFALILESHVTNSMPEVLPVVPLTGVFFGGSQKYLDEMNKQFVVFSNIMRRLVKPLGEEFQHALMQHDVYAYVEVIRELDQPMQELAQFMLNFQHIALPKKDPFLRLRELMIQFYDEVRNNLMRIVDLLDERSELTPDHAKMGTISVSLMPSSVHEFSLLMNYFPAK